MRQLLIPLKHLRLYSESLDLGQSKIALTTDVLGEKNFNKLGIKYTLCINTIEHNWAPSGKQARRTLDRALAAFKIFKDRLVTSQWIFDQAAYLSNTEEYEPEFLPHYVYFRDRYDDEYSFEYRILKSEELDYKMSFEKFLRLSPLPFCISRFQHAVYKPFVIDRFLDYMISLDSLLIPVVNSKKSKFVKSGVAVLSKDIEVQSRLGDRSLEEVIAQLYDIRNAIVHGDNNRYAQFFEDSDKTGLTKRMQEARLFVRGVIKYFHNCDERLLEDTKARLAHLENDLNVIFDGNQKKGC